MSCATVDNLIFSAKLSFVAQLSLNIRSFASMMGIVMWTKVCTISFYFILHFSDMDFWFLKAKKWCYIAIRFLFFFLNYSLYYNLICFCLDIRCACRHCRFKKCVAVGMDSKGFAFSFFSVIVGWRYLWFIPSF